MAKKKKRSTHRRSRRRVSGIGGGAVMEVVAMAAGAVGGQIISQKFGDKLDPKIMAALQAVGGIFIASKGKGIIVSLGKGLAVSGVLAGAKSLNLISGIGAAPLVTFNDNSLGYPNTPVIQGFQNPNNVMAGMNEMAVISGATEQYY
jgi:hypothetical protein